MKRFTLCSLLAITIILQTIEVGANELKAVANIVDSRLASVDAQKTVFYVKGSGERIVYASGFETICSIVSKELSLNIEYVKTIALKISPMYLDRDPDLTTDTSLIELTDKEIKILPSLEIKGDYRGDSKYFPDVLYTLCSGVQENKAKRVQNSSEREDLNDLNDEIRDRILFYEAFISFFSTEDVPIESISNIYREFLELKSPNEYVVEIAENGVYTIANKFKGVCGKYGFHNTNLIAIAFSLDRTLMQSSDYNVIRKEEFPFVYGETSRKNMLLASLGLVGKVRYVWGGGHGIPDIKGYSPIWFVFNDMYKGNENTSISPSGSWCPVHGNTHNCAYTGENIRSVSEYRELREGIFSKSKYWSLLNKNIEKVYENEIISPYGIGIHRVEGLDCSGFCSWLYNQVDTTRKYDSSAANFITSGGLKVVSKEEILPGDVISWSSHIVAVVGESRDNVYIVVESSAYTVKLGVYYFNGTKIEDINYSVNLAKKYNKLLGNLSEDSPINKLNLDNLDVNIGRLNKEFIDTDDIIDNLSKRIIDMTAQEILEYISDRLPEEYKWGEESGINEFN